MHVCMYACVCMYIDIYITRNTYLVPKRSEMCAGMSDATLYIYIYIYIYKEKYLLCAEKV